jgi:hypothetical protein
MMIIRSFGYNLIQSNLFKKSFTAQMESNKLNFENLFNFKLDDPVFSLANK